MSYNTENGAALQKLPEKPHDKGKPKNKMFSKNTRANKPEPPYNQRRSRQSSASRRNLLSKEPTNNYSYLKTITVQ